MPRIIHIGPTTVHVGKSLWEILGNLKNFGVGRVVKRNIYERYPEPTFFRILKVEAMPVPTDSKDLRKVRVYTERVFRGRQFEKIFEMCHETWKPDFRLVPKSEEKALIERAEAAALNLKSKSLPATINFPPLLKAFIIEDRISKGLPTDEEPKLKMVICQYEDLLYKLAEEGEKPTVEYSGGKGKPVSPEMYDIPELFKKKLEP